MKPTMKKSRKEIFLKNLGLQPIKIQRPMEEKNDINICEQICFYYFDDDEGVICRRCYKKFKKLSDFRLHLNTLSCHITLRNYKLNTYNGVYKKYKLKKSKSKKNLETLNTRKTRKSTAQLMDLETLNTRKTRNRCYQNTRAVVTVSKSSSDPGSINSKKATVKALKREGDVIYISSDESVEESNTKPNDLETLNNPKTRNRAVVTVPKSSSDQGSINSKKATVKTLKREGDVIYISSDESVEESNTKPNDLETLNNPKTRNRAVVTVPKSSSDQGSINSKKATVKTLKREGDVIYISSDESVEESNTKPNGFETLNTAKTRNMAVVTVSKSSSDQGSINSKKATVKTLKREGDVIYISSDESVEESNTKPNDLETLNNPKTRNRAVVTVSKSSSDQGSINSKKATVKTLKRGGDVIYISSDESVEESNTKPNGFETLNTAKTRNMAVVTVSKSSSDQGSINSKKATVKTLKRGGDVIYISSDESVEESNTKPNDFETLNTAKTRNMAVVTVSKSSSDQGSINSKKATVKTLKRGGDVIYISSDESVEESNTKPSDLETLNTAKTRNRCYQNTRAVVTVSKSSSDQGSINSKKATVKTLKREGDVIYISSDESVEESNTKPNDCDIIKIHDIPNNTNTIIPKSPHDNQMTLNVKTKGNTDDLSQVSTDNYSSSSAHFPPKYQYVCVICKAQFINKSLLTIHEVEHIRSDSSTHSIVMAEFKACRQEDE